MPLRPMPRLSPLQRASAAIAKAATTKRYVTDHCGGTVPSWPRITIQVEPQIAVKMQKGITTWRSRSLAAVLFPGRPSARSRGVITGSCCRSHACIANQSGPEADKARLSQRRDCGGETVERFALLVPAGDDADLTRAPFIEIEALRPQALAFLIAHAEENLVRFDGIDEPVLSGGSDFLRGRVGGAGIVEPQIAFEHREDLRGEVAALGQ